MDHLWVRDLDGKRREIDLSELWSLKKDIVLFYDETLGEGDLLNVYLPKYAYDKPYWEYLLIDGGQDFSEQDRFFFRAGCLCLIIAMAHEYLDYSSGNQGIFGRHAPEDIGRYVQELRPPNETLRKLSDLAFLGLKLVNEAVVNSGDEFEHPEIEAFYDGGRWVHDTVIKGYFENGNSKQI